MKFSYELQRERSEQAKIAKEYRQEILLGLKSRTITLSDAFYQMGLGNRYIARIHVIRALKAIPGIGERTAKKIMSKLGIPKNRRLGGLSNRQRDELQYLTERYSK